MKVLDEQSFESMLNEASEQDADVNVELSRIMFDKYNDRLKGLSQKEAFFAASGKECTQKFLQFNKDLDKHMTPERKDVVLALMNDMWKDQDAWYEKNRPNHGHDALINMMMKLMDNHHE